MRKLATIRRIDEINPIEGADAIEVCTIGGWKVVAQKNLYKAGDLAVYFEVDSFIPNKLAPFLTKEGHYPKVYEGVEGERLKTIKLRGQISQGLLMPLVEIDKFFEVAPHWSEDEDVTEVLGILKWEKEIPACLAGISRGNFPSFIPKTDQERCQNLKKEIAAAQYDEFEVTEKLDGSSMTVYVNGDEFGVCSRNLNLKEAEGNSFWRTARALDLETKIRSLGRNLAFQGELIGEGIQNNRYGVKGQEFFLFDIYDIDNARYLDPTNRWAIVKKLCIQHVPLIFFNFPLDATIDDLLQDAEGKSDLNPKTEREGFVYKCMKNGFTFKAISNKFLMKNGD